MKKMILFFTLSISVIAVFSQDITTMWPYIYPDFQTGTIYFQNKKTLTAPVNIHLLKSSLHYVDKEIIKEVQSSDVILVQINQDKYYMRDNQMMRVVVGDSLGFVAELVVADFNAVSESGGAYGSSSNVQATRKLSSLEVGGISITNHMELKGRKDAGSLLPVVKKYFIVTVDKVLPANRKSIENELSESKRSEFKKFIKMNKVNWKRPESLMAVLKFLNEK